MKVAIWTERFYPAIGGLEKSMMKLALKLVNKGIEVDVISTCNMGLGNVNFVDFKENNFLADSANYLNHNSTNYDLLYLSRIFQGNESTHLEYLSLINTPKYVVLRIPTTFNIELIKRCDFNSTIKNKITHFIVQNKESFKICRKLYPEKACIISINSNSYPDKFNISYKNYFLFSGRITQSKNLLNLLNAWEIVIEKTRHLYLKPKLKIYGCNYEPKYFEECMIKIKNLYNVEYCGQYHPDDYSVIDNSFFTIIPSEREGHSNVALEAISFGTPVIASKIPGLVEELKHLNEYSIKDPFDKNEIAEKIIKAFSIDYFEYVKLVHKLRHQSLSSSKKESKHFNLINLINLIEKSNLSVLIVKPEAVSYCDEIKEKLQKSYYEIIYEGNNSRWDLFIKEFYHDLNETQILEYISSYTKNKFGLRFKFFVVYKENENTLNELIKVKGDYSSYQTNSKDFSLRGTYGRPKKDNLYSSGKVFVYNGIHCPRSKLELVNTILFLNPPMSWIYKFRRVGFVTGQALQEKTKNKKIKTKNYEAKKCKTNRTINCCPH